jgi:hypothetical protein
MKKPKLLMLIVAWAITCATYAQVKDVTTIGKAIPKETASDWTLRFKQNNPGAVLGHYYGANVLREILHTEGLAGVLIFNGLDHKGNIHLVFKAADKNGEVIASAGSFDDGTLCPPVCPPKNGIAGIGSRIEDGIAQQMIENFQSHNQGKVFSNLYGKTVFENILAVVGVEGIYFSNGIDEKGAEHLVLAGVNKNGEVVEEAGPFNDGLLCPPYNCPRYPPKNSVTAKKN